MRLIYLKNIIKIKLSGVYFEFRLYRILKRTEVCTEFCTEIAFTDIFLYVNIRCRLYREIDI